MCEVRVPHSPQSAVTVGGGSVHWGILPGEFHARLAGMPSSPPPAPGPDPQEVYDHTAT